MVIPRLFVSLRQGPQNLAALTAVPWLLRRPCGFAQVAVEHGAAFINHYQVHVLIDICGLHANGTVVYRWPFALPN